MMGGERPIELSAVFVRRFFDLSAAATAAYVRPVVELTACFTIEARVVRMLGEGSGRPDEAVDLIRTSAGATTGVFRSASRRGLDLEDASKDPAAAPVSQMIS